jgi:hypothetical protein
MHRVEDHYAIHRTRTELDEAKDFLIDMVVGMLAVAMPMALVYGLMVWLELLK